MGPSIQGPLSGTEKILVYARVEGSDRKSFLCHRPESKAGVDGFRFRDPNPASSRRLPIPIPIFTTCGLCNTRDGWIYGLFCTERRDPRAKPSDQSSAVAQCGIVRTKGLKNWERLFPI